MQHLNGYKNAHFLPKQGYPFQQGIQGKPSWPYHLVRVKSEVRMIFLHVRSIAQNPNKERSDRRSKGSVVSSQDEITSHITARGKETNSRAIQIKMRYLQTCTVEHTHGLSGAVC